ncbi:MAG: MlaD family protein [Phycisphaerales bacterium]
MNKTLFRDFLTGLTSLMGLVGLIIMLMLFGEISPSLINKQFEFSVTLTNAGGLSDSSAITLDGVKVGRVTSIENAAGVGARVRVQAREAAHIPRRAKVSVERGLTGDATLDFRSVGLSQSDLADVIRKDDVVDGGSPGSLLGGIQDALQEPLARLGKTADNIDALAVEYRKLGERLNDMVEPRTLDEVAGGKPANLRSTLARMDKALADADQWLGDSQMRTTTRDLLERAGRVVDQAQDLTRAWTSAANKVETTVGDISTRANEVSAEFKSLSGKAQDVLTRAQSAADQLTLAIEKVNKGEGTAGRLLTDPSLYNNLDDAADRLSKVLDEAQQLLEKYKAEGIPLKL